MEPKATSESFLGSVNKYGHLEIVQRGTFGSAVGQIPEGKASNPPKSTQQSHSLWYLHKIRHPY